MVKDARAVSKSRKRESGAVLVEFAFVLLPTMGLVFLLLNLAWAIFIWACAQEGVREGARVAITCNPTNGSLWNSIQPVVQQFSLGFVPSSALQVQYFYLNPNTNALSPVNPPAQVSNGDIVKVSVSALKINPLAAIVFSPTPMYVSASAADIMACPSPQSQ